MQSTALRIAPTRPRPGLVDPLINALVLDDSDFDRRRLRRMTREAAMPLILDEAESIEALRAALDEDVFDVIFIDYRLPEGDGLLAQQLIRAHPRHAHCPTIMLAGNDDPEVGLKALRMGCSEYLLKTRLTVDTLRDTVNEAIDKAKAQVAGTRQREEVAARVRQTVVHQVCVALQPEVAGVMRSARSIRSAASEETFELHDELEALETRCIGLWGLLASLETDLPE